MLAFYAGCRHEVRPVRVGYRIALTYNLSLAGRPKRVAVPSAADPEQAAALATLLRRHFETPAPKPRWLEPAATGRPANRLVYLLDHQ